MIDDIRRLRGVVPIRRLVSAPPDSHCGEMTIDVRASVLPEADQEEVARLVARYDLLAIPVTDIDGVMLGVITVDDVIDVITAEATEDMYHLAGLSEEDRVFTTASLAIRKRLPWMILNLGAVFTRDEPNVICNAHIDATEGPLPVGAHTWQCWVDEKWVEHTLTVTLQ